MSQSQETPKIPLPRGWKKQVRSAVLHVLSLAQYARRQHPVRRLTSLAELARLGHVTPARASQIMRLLQLAPDIQEAVRFLEFGAGRERVSERDLRPIAAVAQWGEQRGTWRALGGGDCR